MSTTATCTKLLFTKDGKTIGVGDVDLDIMKTLTGAERKLAAESFALDDEDIAGHEPFWDRVLGVFLTYSLYHIVTMIWSGELSVAKFLFFAVAMFFYTDIVSGFLHLVLDNPWFLLSPIDSLCRGFQEHHLDTTLITKMSIWQHVRVVNMPICVSTALGFVFNYNAPLFYCYAPFFTASLYYMQMCHRWAHTKSQDRGPVVSWLQKTGLGLAPTEHLKHHHPPYNRSFCIMNGWANPMLNYVVDHIPGGAHGNVWLFLFVGIVVGPHFLWQYTV